MNELDKPIGTKEQPKLTAGSVIVQSVTIDDLPTSKGGKAKIVALHCKHPDKPELIRLNNMKIKKVQGNNETLTKDGIWYREDNEGNISKTCNTAELMRFYSKETLGQFVGSVITTELDASGYLIIKAY